MSARDIRTRLKRFPFKPDVRGRKNFRSWIGPWKPNESVQSGFRGDSMSVGPPSRTFSRQNMTTDKTKNSAYKLKRREFNANLSKAHEKDENVKIFMKMLEKRLTEKYYQDRV